MIQWSDKYKTGHERIDRQHQQLFEFFNDLESIIQEGRGRSHLDFSLHFLGLYVQFHFGFEEDCMTKCRCPFAQRNKEAHEEFRIAFQAFKDEVQVGGDSDAIMTKMYGFLEAWIDSHILAIDTHLMDAVKTGDPSK